MPHPNSLKNLKPWVKGQSGYANHGGPKLTEELRAIRSLSHTEVTKLISKYARMSLDDLLDSLQAKKAPVVELHIASIFATGIQTGDFSKLSFLLDRCIGKVKEIIEDDEAMEAREELQKLSLNELLTLVKSNLPEAG